MASSNFRKMFWWHELHSSRYTNWSAVGTLIVMKLLLYCWRVDQLRTTSDVTCFHLLSEGSSANTNTYYRRIQIFDSNGNNLLNHMDLMDSSINGALLYACRAQRPVQLILLANIQLRCCCNRLSSSYSSSATHFGNLHPICSMYWWIIVQWCWLVRYPLFTCRIDFRIFVSDYFEHHSTRFWNKMKLRKNQTIWNFLLNKVSNKNCVIVATDPTLWCFNCIHYIRTR